jgi:hypothetical protein
VKNSYICFFKMLRDVHSRTSIGMADSARLLWRLTLASMG